MHNLEFITNNTEWFINCMKRRGVEEGVTYKLLMLNQVRRQKIYALEKKRQEKNTIIKNIASLKDRKNSSAFQEMVMMTKDLDQSIKSLEYIKENDDIQDILASLPNIVSDKTPSGCGEMDNIIDKVVGEKKDFLYDVKSHDSIGMSLNMMDFQVATSISSARFVVLKGVLAKLERALIQFMLDVASASGYLEYSVPFMVNDQSLFNTGQFPKFKEDIFRSSNNLNLIPTGEVPLINVHQNKIFAYDALPLRMVAVTPCFRREAGSGGKDTKGMLRQHQFTKIELAVISDQDNSYTILEEMVSLAESILEMLDLPYRRVILCDADLGFSSAFTYDIEVWIPSQRRYREISSCSNCADFQARRMKTFYKQDNKKRLVHTLNASALAVGRLIVAILENYQNSDGSVSVPDKLLDYLGGVKVISKIEE
ncbi:MAG: seryl-tRNA synthetase [Candidatus Xenolissoclinum pacificiensis L6]|uniref:Serine--tRNA ligase n=1 Tax=Candidatus Xenolissoclinum pacificiensis L6 TaxID=1401685 RepID=W2UY44_9RICK|nr:MAG: seryl-tRNA synthetase [Candidatus Xenolissoclinum pacificiensis L6]